MVLSSPHSGLHLLVNPQILPAQRNIFHEGRMGQQVKGMRKAL